MNIFFSILKWLLIIIIGVFIFMVLNEAFSVIWGGSLDPTVYYIKAFIDAVIILGYIVFVRIILKRLRRKSTNDINFENTNSIIINIKLEIIIAFDEYLSTNGVSEANATMLKDENMINAVKETIAKAGSKAIEIAIINNSAKVVIIKEAIEKSLATIDTLFNKEEIKEKNKVVSPVLALQAAFAEAKSEFKQYIEQNFDSN